MNKPQPRMPTVRSPRPPGRPPAGRLPKQRGGSGGFWLVLVIVAAAGGLYWFTRKQPAPVEPPAVVVKPEPVKPVEPPKPKLEQAPMPEPAKPVAKAKPAAPKQAEPAPASAPVPPVPDLPDFATIFGGTLSFDERSSAAAAETRQRMTAALDTALAHSKWDEWSALLQRSMLAAMKAVGASSVTPAGLMALSKAPLFNLALAQSAFISTLDPTARQQAQKKEELRPFYTWLLGNPAAMEAWLLTVRPADDDVALALEQWAKLAQEDAAAKEQYRNLALACALVFEKPMNFKWNYKDLNATAPLRYNFYKTHAEKGDLAVKPDKLSARDLVWVVSAPVPDSEMEWALAKMRLRQKNWGSAYDMVAYDMERAVKDTNKYDAYTFAEILKKGGICGDRAYFSSNTARAAGIPAAYVSGDGSRGPHAWVTWLADDNQWSFAGRYGGYPLGNTRNPQTGKQESEQEFIRRTDRAASDEGLLQGLRPVWLAQAALAAGSADIAALTLDGACQLGAKIPAVWQAKLAFWSAHRGEAPLEQWRGFMDVLKRQMKDDPNLLAEARAAEEKFIFPRQDAKLAMKELKKDARRLETADGDTAVDQADQIAKVLRQQAEVLQKNGQLDPVRGLYDKSYREHGRNPAVFKQLVTDCWELVKSDPEVAKKACRDMEASFRRYVEAGGDYFDITSQMSALKIIEACYREIGEERKAETLAKDIAKANEKAEKRAL